jgi:Zn-dependent peptidase ImmA (M78 family)
MPAEVLRAEIGKHRESVSLGELISLKKLFGVSLQAITYRCRDLGIIPESVFKKPFDTFRERGWRAAPFQEPEAMPPEVEQPKRLERLCFRALAEKALSESKTAEILGISVHELNKRMDMPEAA